MQHSCPIIVANSSPSARKFEPVTLGLPLPPGWCGHEHGLALLDGSGNRTSLQSRALESWPDGSVRWALIDFQASCAAAASTHYSLIVSAEPRREDSGGLTIRHGSDSVSVDTTTARFELGTGDHFPFMAVHVGTGAPLDCRRTRFTIEDGNGVVHSMAVHHVAVEETGPVRACVRLEGPVGPLLHVVARLHFFARSATVKVVLTVRNPRRAHHPGGLWELGDAGSLYMRDASLTIAAPETVAPLEVRCSAEPGEALQVRTLPLELYQESSGGAHWNSNTHVNRFGKVPLTFKGYRLREGHAEARGLRATPIVSATAADIALAASVPQFWQNFPKAIDAFDRSVVVRLFPRQFGDLHELQGGEQKTSSVYLAVDLDRVTDDPLEWSRAPLIASTEPEWYCRAHAVPFLVPATEERSAEYLRLVNGAIEGSSSFFAKREIIDEFGWRNFGDLYADHEAVGHEHDVPLVSHYNNQYDAVAGFAVHFFRTGDPRWLELMRDLAAHVVDIDCYHTREDKSAYNGGLFWHTYHYTDAGRSTHRGYPSAPGVPGGGPSDEHDYSTGLMLRYFLTGERAFLDAVCELARWVMEMDDGRRTPLRWIVRSETGLASASGTPLYHGPGRGAAYSILTLLNAHRLIGEAALLDKAEQLIRRCIHPRDDIPARGLLDAERRWFYTVFLQALGRYLHYKIERGELDATYAYARESLLHYARWMVEHESPYLDKPETLEYPNETWAAQDMRKSEVFMLAAMCSHGQERRRFVERGDFFFQYSAATLAATPAAALARPTVLMLGNGYMHAWFGRNPDASMPSPASDDNDFGQPARFVPQKARAVQRLKKLTIVLTATAILAALGMLWL